MAATHHEKCLRRAKVRREAGLPTNSQEKKIRVETAWRNIFVKSGYLQK
jgi:hypothetical protein